MSVRDFQSKIPSFSDIHPHLPLHLILYHFSSYYSSHTVVFFLKDTKKKNPKFKKKKKSQTYSHLRVFPLALAGNGLTFAELVLAFIICHLSEAVLTHPKTDFPYPLVFLDPGLLFHVLQSTCHFWSFLTYLFIYLLCWAIHQCNINSMKVEPGLCCSRLNPRELEQCLAFTGT